MLEYKGYTGVVSFDDECELFHGDVIGIKGVITFKGTSVKEIKREFKESVNSYLEFCKEINKEPEKPFSGKFVLRMDSDMHRKLVLKAMNKGDSLNKYVLNIINEHAV